MSASSSAHRYSGRSAAGDRSADVTSVLPTLPGTIAETPARRRLPWPVACTSLVALASVGLLAGLTGTAQAATAVPLGAAQSFAVLAGGGITNTGPTTVSGDIGSFATTSIDGGITLSGASQNHGGDSVTQSAKAALSAALVTAAGAGPATPVAGGQLSGLLLPPGVYNSGSSLGLTGVLTLNGGGSYDSVFIFQAGSDLTTASSSSVVLVNGAQACNVFWQVGISATLGSDSVLRGTVLADTAITLNTRAEVVGRVLASTAAVTLDSNKITRPSTCRTGRVNPVGIPPTTAPPTTPPPTTPPTTPPVTAPTTAAPPASPSPAGTAGPVRATGTGASGRGSTDGRTTYGQVGRVPVGAVDTGDGSTAG
jgi:hypothetical protein